MHWNCSCPHEFRILPILSEPHPPSERLLSCLYGANLSVFQNNTEHIHLLSPKFRNFNVKYCGTYNNHKTLKHEITTNPYRRIGKWNYMKVKWQLHAPTVLTYFKNKTRGFSLYPKRAGTQNLSRRGGKIPALAGSRDWSEFEMVPSWTQYHCCRLLEPSGTLKLRENVWVVSFLPWSDSVIAVLIAGRVVRPGSAREVGGGRAWKPRRCELRVLQARTRTGVTSRS